MKITKEMRTSNEELEKLGLPPHSYKYKFHELDLWTQIAIHRQIVKQIKNSRFALKQCRQPQSSYIKPIWSHPPKEIQFVGNRRQNTDQHIL